MTIARRPSAQTESRLVLGAGLVGVALSTLGFVAWWIGVAGGVIAAGALIWQYRSGGAVVIPFSESDWTPAPPPEADGEVAHLMFVVPFAAHGRKVPTPTTLTRTKTGDMVEGGVTFQVSPDRSVCLYSVFALGSEVRIT